MATSPPSSGLDLSDAVARAKAGDREALEAILATIAPSIHRFGLRMCRNVHDAEDVLQEALLAVATHLGEFEGRSSLSSWAFALTRTACARKRRGMKNRPPISDASLAEAPDDAPSPEARASRQELGTTLFTALDRLSEDYREIILLRDVEGLSAPQAADALGVSVDAVKSRLHRAREALRDALKPMLEPHPDRGTAGCPDVVALWSRKLEGDLSQSDCSAMEKHLAGCPSCSAACQSLKQALSACQRLRSEDVPPEVQARIKSAVRAWAALKAPVTRRS